MNCKKCGMPTVEGGTYCGYCGARVDGKKACHACGQLNEEHFSFCVGCGTRIDGKTACPNCGTAFEGSFCPTCGAANKGKPVNNQTKREGRFSLSSVMEKVGGASMILGVLFSLIFVFFIGLVESLDGVRGEKVGLFTFFGEYYKEMKTEEITEVVEATSKWWGNLIEEQTTLYGVFGTIISAATLLCVVGFATVAIVKYILSFVNKTKDDSKGWALACIASYLIGAVLFYAHIRMQMSIYADGESSEGIVNFNGATVVGLVFALVFLGLGIIGKLIAKGKTSWTGGKCVATVCALVGVLFAGAMVAAAQFSAFSFELFANGASINLTAGYGIFNIAADIGLAPYLYALPSQNATTYQTATTALSQMNLWNVFCICAVILLGVVAGGTLCATLRGRRHS